MPTRPTRLSSRLATSGAGLQRESGTLVTITVPAGKLVIHSHWLDDPLTCMLRAQRRGIAGGWSSIDRKIIRERIDR